MEIPRIFWLPILYSVILLTRPQQSAKLYRSIWRPEGAPLVIYSKQIAAKLSKQLGIPVEIGMHYGEPSIESSLQKLRRVKKLGILPLYPQYSASTTAATFDLVAAVLKKWRHIPEIHFINDYADDPLYINAIADSIAAAGKIGTRDHLLFSFHGIPKRYADAGDPYPERCQLTAKLDRGKVKFRCG